MGRRRKSSHSWVYMIWGINALILGLVLLVAILYTTSLRASAADEPADAALPQSTRRLPPTSYFLPTLTPNPLYTPPVFESPTPFVLAEGMRPSVIGFSLAGRPIEVYKFGAGQKEYLVVAGIHGGYEGNTIALGMIVPVGTLAAVPALAAALVTLPVLFSGFVFSAELRKTADVPGAMASNLVGAIAGGLIEYNSMYFGFNALGAAAIGLYAVAWGVSCRRKSGVLSP